MTEPRRMFILALSLLPVACGGLTSLPAAPSATLTPQATTTSAPLPVETAPAPAPVPAPAHTIGPEVPAGLAATQRVITGTVGPLASYASPCYVGLYACERYRFTLQKQGAVEVTLSWQGGPRAMLIQLYRAGAGLVHEDVAPRDGAPAISFRRVGLEPIEYELRVVNWEPSVAHNFTLTITTWQ